MRSRALSLFVLSCLAGTSTGAWAQVFNPSDSWDVRPLNLRMRAPGALDHVRCGKQCIGARLLAAGLNPDGTPMFSPTGQNDDDGMATREASTATDLLSCKLEIEFVPSSGTNNVIGKNTMQVKSLVNGLTQFTFRLRSQYTISALTVDGVNATASVPGANSYGRTITLPRAYDAGEIMTIAITYNGLAASRGFGSIEFTSLGGNSAIFTLSEPYYAATWWPVKDGDVFQPGDNSDKFTAEIWVTVPTAMTVATNGLLQGIDTLSGSRRRHRWQTNYQIAPYLVAIGATTYNTWTKNYTPASGGTMPVQFFLAPSSDNASQRADWEKCITMMETYRTMGGSGGYGLYPFFNEKYGLYQFTFGGGMEHQTMTGQLATISESLTAHELGHQWWGDNVTCKTWNNIWLNEGFATYTECLWEEFKPGSSGFPALQSAINARNPGASAGAVYKSDVSDPNTIFDGTTSYNKGAWVLHMLRHAVGSDATFWQILQTYRAAYEGSGATTDDFFNVVNSVTGQDFTAFRDKWVYGTGSPTYQYGWQTALINGQNYLKLRIDQTGSFGFFNTPIDVRVNYSGGSVTQLMQNTADPQWYLIPIPAAATAVTLDPNGWVLNGGKTSVAYVAGPPRVIATSPAIGATTAPGAAPTETTINFSDNVTSAASDYTVTKDGSPVAFTLSYNAATFKTTLDFGGTLEPGVYTVTAKSTIVAAGGSTALDGEISGATLPSGNGVAGGNAVFTFTVDGCPSDYNGDGFVDAIDYDGFITAWLANDLSADYNGDEFVDAIDYDGFITDWLNNC